MKNMSVVVGCFLFFVGVAFGQTDAQTATAAPQKAKATLIDTQGKEIGHATLTEEEGGVMIDLDISSKVLTGMNGFHIHEKGQCDPPGFESAGGHLNPFGMQHGSRNPQGAHLGDLPNIAVGGLDGTQAQIFAYGVTLGSGENSLFHPGGTSLVVHARYDDEITDPTGNSGPRVACGVITKE